MTIIIDGTVGANKAVVLDAAGKLPAIDGSLVTTLNATQVTTGSIATARLDTGTTNGKVLVLDGSGNMPAIAATNMTGVASATTSASDPTVSTNPATGLGTKWINTTSGELFILTDATAGANRWTSTGATSGDIAPDVYQGTQYGYTAGRSGSPTNLIQRVSFTADGNATDVGDMVSGEAGCGCTHSNTVGYIVGGGSSGRRNIEKFTFASGGNSVAMSALLLANVAFGATACTKDYGYHMAGQYPGVSNVIQKWSQTADTDSADVGDLLSTKGRNPGAVSYTHLTLPTTPYV